MTAPSSGNLFKSLFECGGVGEVTGLDSLSVVPSLVPSGLLSSGWKVMAGGWGCPACPAGLTLAIQPSSPTLGGKACLDALWARGGPLWGRMVGRLGHCLLSGLRCPVRMGGGAVSDQGVGLWGSLGMFPEDRATRGRGPPSPSPGRLPERMAAGEP